MDYVKYFEPLELDREAGRIDAALLKSQQALLAAAEQNDPVLAINALGHQLLIFKDQFTRTGNDFYLHFQHAVAAAGLQLAQDFGVSGQPVAVMYLRAGDYFFYLKKYKSAITELSLALDNLGDIRSIKPGEYAEYLSHLGKAKVFAGESEDGLKLLEMAVELTAKPTELREFHHKVVYSGNMLRLAESYHLLGRETEVQNLIGEIYPIARELKEKFDMPLRLEQTQKAAEIAGLRLP